MSNIGLAQGPDNKPLLEQTGFRLSWGAIIAGVVVATAVHIVLTLIGIAIGLDAWDAGDNIASVGGTLGIWTIVAGIIALFAGGITTGRLAGILTRGDGALHGVVLWSISTIMAAWLVASGVGMVVGGAFGVVSRTASAAVGAVGNIGGAALGGSGNIDFAALEREVMQALRETGDPALRPDTLAADAQQVGRDVTSGATNESVAREVVQTVRDRAGRIDREAITNVLAARTGMSRPDAERVAARVETMGRAAAQETSTMLDTASARAAGIATDASDLIAAGAWWALLALGLSFGAAVGGVMIKARD